MDLERLTEQLEDANTAWCLAMERMLTALARFSDATEAASKLLIPSTEEEA